MKKICLLAVFLLSAVLTFAGNGYKLNDEKIDQLFNQATEISLLEIMNPNQLYTYDLKATYSEISDKIIISVVVMLVFPPFAWLGLHRHVLGTRPGMWIMYLITCGGIFSIVPIVDWFVLLINGLIENQGDKYLNNDKFFMWLN